MLHYTPRSVHPSYLFHTWTEGLALWRRLNRIPGVATLCVMPTHVHVLARRDVSTELHAVMRGYARLRNRTRDTPGERVWRALGEPMVAEGEQKERRDDRYIHLNPCRAKLVECPLDWPLSTHRDAVGLAVGPRRVRAQAAAYHDYISKDQHTGLRGTRLPDGEALTRFDATALPDIEAAVSAVLRCTDEELRRRGPARNLYLRCAKLYTMASGREIAALVGVDTCTANRVAGRQDAASRIVGAVAGDTRFSLLPAHLDLRSWFRGRRC